MNGDYFENVRIFKAFCDENRWKILEILRGGEKCACVLLNKLNITQPTLSHHMKILCESGIISGRKEGKWMHYSINEDIIEVAKSKLDSFCKNIDNLNELDDINNSNECCREEIMDNKKTKLYVLTGFLGSGKTTILIKLLNELSKNRVGVIQNEFGKLGIDGTILRNDDIQMVEINKGSIFCSCLKLSFVQALSEMSQKNLEYLFVESSGLADPSNIEEILEAVKHMSGYSYEFKGVICLIDAVNFLDQLDDLETVYRQLKHCHLAVLTKVDLVDDKRIDELKLKIREINPACRIDMSSNGSLDTEFLNEDLTQYKWAEGEETTNKEETKPKTLFMNFEYEVPKEKLESFIREIEDSVYRIKGFFKLENEGWCQIDLVGKNIDYKKCESQPKSQMVFISKIGPQLIKKIFEAWEKNVGMQMELKN